MAVYPLIMNIVLSVGFPPGKNDKIFLSNTNLKTEVSESPPSFAL